jgi:hypothetical protein
MQINNLPAALLYWVQSWLLFKRFQCQFQCWIQWCLQYGIQCHICFEIKLLSWMISQPRLSNPELHNYDDNWWLQIDFRIKPFQSMCPKKPYEISHWWRNDLKRRKWLYRNLNPYHNQLLYRKYTWTWIIKWTEWMMTSQPSKVIWWQTHLQMNWQAHPEEPQQAHPMILDDMFT